MTARTAADVRHLFRTNPARLARLTEAAQVSVREGARGNLHPEAIREFNRGRKAAHRYERGNSGTVKAETLAVSKSQREAVVKAGLAGARGPLSAAAKEFLAQSKG